MFIKKNNNFSIVLCYKKLYKLITVQKFIYAIFVVVVKK